MTRRDDMTKVLIDQAENMDARQALAHARAAAKFWRKVRQITTYLARYVGPMDEINAALWVLGAVVSKLSLLGVADGEVIDLVHAMQASNTARRELAERTAVQAAAAGEPEN